MQESLFPIDPAAVPAKPGRRASSGVSTGAATPPDPTADTPADHPSNDPAAAHLGAPESASLRTRGIQPAVPTPEALALAADLSPLIRLGGSTWSYPGWAGLVWDKPYSESQLSRRGLQAYARHPLLRCVCVDRTFYRGLTASQYEQLAQQVGDDFRFLVKGPALVCDAQMRDEQGRGRQVNPAFLDPGLALQDFVQPAMEGLGHKLGALVFQLSPLPAGWLGRMDECLAKLDRLLAALPDVPALRQRCPQGAIAIEVRDAQWLTDSFVQVLRRHGASYCLGLHPKLPAIEDQLWILRRLWPAPLVCRWNLHRRHGPFGYEDAEQRYGDYSRLVDPDPDTREALARVARATAAAGLPAYVGISNHAEGCAPLSALALAASIRGLQKAG